MLRALPTTLIPLLLLAGPVHADVGATVSLQSDARERGVSYSGDKPSAQLGLAWDGAGGWYGGAALARVRFDSDRSSGWLRGYAGRVVELRPGLDAEAGLVAHRYVSVSRYDYWEAYAGLLGEGWNLRLHHAPDHYGSGQRTLYGEVNGRWPLGPNVTAVGHVGVLRSHGAPRWAPRAYAAAHRPTRIDLRAGASWQLGDSVDVQLAWVSASRGGPQTWLASTRRQAVVLGLSAAF